MMKLTKQRLTNPEDNQVRSKEGNKDEGNGDEQAADHCLAKSNPLTDVSG